MLTARPCAEGVGKDILCMHVCVRIYMTPNECGHVCVLQDLSSTDNVLDVVFFFDDKIECRCA